MHRTFHYLINRFLTLVSNVFSGLYLTDMETCYKVFHSDVIKNLSLTSKRFGFEPEVTAKIAKLNVKIKEYPIAYFPRNFVDGKKIGWRDGVAALWFIFKHNASPLDQASIDALPSRFLSNSQKARRKTPI